MKQMAALSSTMFMQIISQITQRVLIKIQSVNLRNKCIIDVA